VSVSMLRERRAVLGTYVVVDDLTSDGGRGQCEEECDLHSDC
jgi:hypothetical protein